MIDDFETDFPHKSLLAIIDMFQRNVRILVSVNIKL